MKIGDLIRDIDTQQIGIVIGTHESIIQTHYKVILLSGETVWFPTDYVNGACEVINENR